MNLIRTDRPIANYLEKDMHPSYKVAIQRRLKELLSLSPEFDSDPIDTYRTLGKILMRKELASELNDIIMSATSSYAYLKPWVKELREIYDNCTTLIETIQHMCRALMQEGNFTGIYNSTKPTTAAADEAL